ncbi:MAG: hypothetical protein IPG22_13830 [Acidobacteria bacterium]|nr:hypothetical protein [Acidobacteriota bacterium]
MNTKSRHFLTTANFKNFLGVWEILLALIGNLNQRESMGQPARKAVSGVPTKNMRRLETAV